MGETERQEQEQLNFGETVEFGQQVRAAEKKISDERFTQWYATYPKKNHPKHAKNMFRRHIKTAADFLRLMRNTRIHNDRQFRYRDLEKIPDPGTFLNRGDWEDDDPPVLNGRKGTTAMERLRNL